jgi:lysophospholipase L1-like esterase
MSDPVQLQVASMSDLLGSVFTAEPVGLFPMGGASMLLTDGDTLLSEKLAGARKVTSRPVMTSVLVIPERPTQVVVALGDSITDGVRDKPSEAHGWVATLAGRMNADPKSSGVAVVSAGISGNQILKSMMGPAALSRVDRDVFSVPGLSHVVLLEGINDIGFSGKTPFSVAPALPLEDLLAGYKQIAMRAHARGVKILIGTLLPAEGAFYFSDDKEKLRQSINAWIRTSKDFDGVIDFEAVIRDPAHPTRMKGEYDSGDHLHPNAAGYKAMGDAIDLSLFR